MFTRLIQLSMRGGKQGKGKPNVVDALTPFHQIKIMHGILKLYWSFSRE
jgi:hypothetical protein